MSAHHREMDNVAGNHQNDKNAERHAAADPEEGKQKDKQERNAASDHHPKGMFHIIVITS